MTDLNEQSMADMVDKINALLNDVAGRIRLKPTEMIVPIATVQKVADEQGVTVEVAKEYLREMARQLMRSTGSCTCGLSRLLKEISDG